MGSDYLQNASHDQIRSLRLKQNTDAFICHLWRWCVASEWVPVYFRNASHDQIRSWRLKCIFLPGQISLVTSRDNQPRLLVGGAVWVFFCAEHCGTTVLFHFMVVLVRRFYLVCFFPGTVWNRWHNGVQANILQIVAGCICTYAHIHFNDMYIYIYTYVQLFQHQCA